MLGSPILDLAIGMAFIYLLLSLIASVVQEIIATITQARAANLERGLHSLFSGDPLELNADGKPGKLFVEALYKHGLVRGLYQDPAHDSKGKEPRRPTTVERFQLAFRQKLRAFMRITPPGYEAKPNDLLLPAYIPARTFSIALIDLLNREKTPDKCLENIQAHLLELKQKNQVAINAAGADPAAYAASSLAEKAGAYENKAVEAIYALLTDAGGKAEKFQANLENWYNDSMDRTSGWYKRYTQRILLVLGLGIAIFFNVDSIHVARTLWFDHDARQGLANAADAYLRKHPDFSSVQATTGDAATAGKPFDLKVFQKGLEGTVTSFNTVSQENMLPLGWRHSFHDYWSAFQTDKADGLGKLLLALIGWCITAGALSLGAPFWFDMLNKIMVVRNTVKPSEKSPNEKSKS